MIWHRFRQGRPRIAVVAIVALAIFVAAVVPTGDAVARTGPFDRLPLDLWLHGLAYFVLEMAVLWALAADSERSVPPILTPLPVVAYGVVLEGIQWGVPYRTVSIADAVANAVGATVALGCWALYVWWQ